MKQFFYDMHGGSDKIRSKSVYASYFVLIVSAMVIGHQFFHMPLDFAVLFTMLSTIGALCGMNLTAQLKAIDAKKVISSDMVKETGDNDAAADVLQSDKPQ